MYQLAGVEVHDDYISISGIGKRKKQITIHVTIVIFMR